ncbi:polyamine transporter Tpo5p [[Candida] jaroonii]|uniref:Polyamine transporter Tpo5p n=1 Tax=[Candida] jaroonii TaxID=467808 RepID=A0ACA9YFH5_9ASCO|nr:polyamine transporter Tpo5p [[Candida] jaroonii]
MADDGDLPTTVNPFETHTNAAHPEAPQASYLSYIPTNSIQTSAPARFLRNLLQEDEEEVEKIEHFKYKQVLDRKLTVKSIIGLGFSIMGVPFGMSSTLWITLVDGANVTMLYGWLVVTFFSLCVILSLSEIISKYPTSGGVYHFSALLSNEKYSLISSWFTGWLLLIGSWTYIVSILFSGSQFILSIFGLKNSYYKEDIFLVLLVYFILLAFCGFINYKFSKYLEKINRACIIWSLGTIVVIDILLLIFSERNHSIKDIMTNFDNSRSGWPAPLAFIVGLSGSAYTMNGYGMLLSMTDEVKNPERNLPKGMVSSILITFVNGLIFIIPLLVILPEMTLLLDDTPEIMPIDLIFKFAIKSYVVSFLLILLLIGTVLFQGIGSITAASRTTYAFARDGGLPYKEKWTTVDAVEEDTVPKNAIFLSMGVAAILPCIAIISESAFNSFMGACVITLTLSNGVPIVALMLNKRRKIKGGAFRLRKLGWFINLLSCFWMVLSTLSLSLPPVVKNLHFYNMNYASVVTLGFLLFASLCYKWYGQKNFEGPKIDSDYFELHNIEALGRDRLEDFTVGDDEDSEIVFEDSNGKPLEFQPPKPLSPSYVSVMTGSTKKNNDDSEILFDADSTRENV